MKILIAEDDRTCRNELRTVLGRWGYETVVAEDGDAAWQVFEGDDPPRLAILDWMMPGRDGPTLCQSLKRQQRLLPLYLILLTSRSEDTDIVRGLNAGADDYLIKPCNHTELQARIEVGRRMLGFMEAVREQEKLQGVLEMSGAIGHELNQPLQCVSGYVDLLLRSDDTDRGSVRRQLNKIKEAADRINELTQRIVTISEYRVKTYFNGEPILDIEKSSRAGNGQ